MAQPGAGATRRALAVAVRHRAGADDAAGAAGRRCDDQFAPSRLPGTDDDTLDRLRALYADDAFFNERLEQALMSQAIAGDMPGMDRAPRRGAAAFATTMRAA